MIIDVIVGLVLLFGFIAGWRSGFIMLVLSVAGFVIQLYAAIHYNQMLAAMLDNYFHVSDGLTTFLAEHIFTPQVKEAMQTNWFSHLPGDFGEKLIAAPAHTFSQYILNILSFVLIFIMVKILLKMIFLLLNRVLDHTIAGPINRALGGMIGLFFTALGIGLLFTLVFYVFNLFPPDPASLSGKLDLLLHGSRFAEALADLI